MSPNEKVIIMTTENEVLTVANEIKTVDFLGKDAEKFLKEYAYLLKIMKNSDPDFNTPSTPIKDTSHEIGNYGKYFVFENEYLAAIYTEKQYPVIQINVTPYPGGHEKALCGLNMICDAWNAMIKEREWNDENARG